MFSAEGLGSFFVAKFLILILYLIGRTSANNPVDADSRVRSVRVLDGLDGHGDLLCFVLVQGSTTDYADGRRRFYLVYSIAEMYIAIALHSELLRGWTVAVFYTHLTADFLTGDKVEDDDKVNVELCAIKRLADVVFIKPYQSPGHTGKYVSRFV